MTKTIVNTNYHSVAIETQFSPLEMIAELLEFHIMDHAPDELIKNLGAYVTHLKNTKPARYARLANEDTLFQSIISGLEYRGEVGDRFDGMDD